VVWEAHADSLDVTRVNPNYTLVAAQHLKEIGGKVTLGGLERWFSPRGQDLALLLSCIGLVRPSSSADLKQNKTKTAQRQIKTTASGHLHSASVMFFQSSTYLLDYVFDWLALMGLASIFDLRFFFVRELFIFAALQWPLLAGLKFLYVS
jgi:hypothetical protein